MIEKENINIDSLIIEDINIEDIIEHVETEHAGKGAHNIKSITYGGIDGIITTFAIMSAAIGANLSEKIIIIMGFSNLIADAFSMGFGDYISSNAERNYIISERKKELKEYDIHRNHEIKELIELYIYNGLDIQDAIQLVNILAS